MHKDYARCVAYWDAVFSQEEPIAPAAPDTGVPGLTRALDWLCQGASHVVDFGCGNGVMLCWCALRGATRVTGVDLSPEAIRQAHRRLSQLPQATARLLKGGVEALASLPDASAQGMLLCNILDNLYPEDCRAALTHCARILAPGGRALIQLNPHLSPAQIEAWGIRVIEGNLLDDGLLLNNLPDAAWRRAIGRHLTILAQEALPYDAAGQPLRLFRAIRPA